MEHPEPTALTRQQTPTVANTYPDGQAEQVLESLQTVQFVSKLLEHHFSTQPLHEASHSGLTVSRQQVLQLGKLQVLVHSDYSGPVHPSKHLMLQSWPP